MATPEQHTIEEGMRSDAQKEQIGQTLFQVRFGLGTHSLRTGSWHELIAQDLDSFFTQSTTTQRNIFF